MARIGPYTHTACASALGVQPARRVFSGLGHGPLFLPISLGLSYLLSVSCFGVGCEIILVSPLAWKPLILSPGQLGSFGHHGESHMCIDLGDL